MIDKLGFDYDKINEADDHNATPLYHAALIGNTEICLFLLQRGAICTEHDSARVFYVALTPSLRSILREWSLSAASIDPYLQSLQQNFTVMEQDQTNTTGGSMVALPAVFESKDCIINIWNTNENSDQLPKTIYRSLAVHRVMLKYRCPFVLDQQEAVLDGDIERQVVHLNGYDKVHCDVLLHFIEYIYTGKIEIMTLEMAFISLQIAKQWNLNNELVIELQSKIDEYAKRWRHKQQTDFDNHISAVATNTQKQSWWSRTTNPVILASLGVDDTTTMTELANNDKDPKLDFLKCTITDIDKLRSDMKQLAQVVSTPQRFSNMNKSLEMANEILFPPEVPVFSDLAIRCQSSIYYVHRFRLIQHSEYFLCALKGNFIESATSTINLSSMIPKNMADVLPLIIQWMYADCFLYPNDVTIVEGIEILHICSALLCSSRLFSYVVNTIIVPNLSVETVFDMLTFSRKYPSNIDRLESKCCEVIAKNLEKIISNEKTSEELQYLIAIEISETRQGGDANTADIPLVADIRRAINRLVNITMVQRLQKLDLLKAFEQLQRDQFSC